MEDKSKFTTVVQKNGAVVIGPNAVGVKGDLSDEDLGKISQIRRSTSSNLQEGNPSSSHYMTHQMLNCVPSRVL